MMHPMTPSTYMGLGVTVLSRKKGHRGCNGKNSEDRVATTVVFHENRQIYIRVGLCIKHGV